MTRTTLVAGGVFAAVVALIGLLSGGRENAPSVAPDPQAASTPPPPEAPGPAPRVPLPVANDQEPDESYLYGRVTTVGDTTYEGRLRFGGNEEAFWGDYFNGSKDQNVWVDQTPPGAMPMQRHQIKILGVAIGHHESRYDVERAFMARFGDIARIEGTTFEVRVKLKSGTEFVLDRNGASDFDDGVHVWDAEHGLVELGARQVRTIELLPTPRLAELPGRLYGTVQTGSGVFSGFVQWDRQECTGEDLLQGEGAEGEISVSFDNIQSIERRSTDSSLVTLRDGREIEMSGTNDVGEGNRGLYVDDPRYGRVLVSWETFERVDFVPGIRGPRYGDFPAGESLTGAVTTRSGERLEGRLVYDLDESETVETLDAPAEGVDYTIPFGLVAAIMVPEDSHHGRVVLHSGEELALERRGDLGDNLGMLVFTPGADRARYVPWAEIERVDFDRPTAMFPTLGESSNTL